MIVPKIPLQAALSLVSLQKPNRFWFDLAFLATGKKPEIPYFLPIVYIGKLIALIEFISF